MPSSLIIQLNNRRFLDLTTYLTVAVMYLLGTRELVGMPARVATVLLGVAFALLYAFVFNGRNFVRYADWYFAGQIGLVVGLLTLSLRGAEFFTLLCYLLTIHVSIVFPERRAAAWIVLFYAITSGGYFVQRGPNLLVPLAFNATVFLLSGMFGNNLRQTELARRHNQQLVAELATAQRQLQTLAVTEERNRLAREIHDGLGHYLTATTMQIQGAKAMLEQTDAITTAPAALTALGKAETLLQEALVDVRRSVAALRTTPGNGQSLAATIQQLVATCQTTAGLQTHFALQGEARPLPPQTELTLFRTAQEGLTNVVKHAQAANVVVILRYAAGKVCLSIADDGQGQGTTSHGFGLLGLRERVQLQGGVLTVDHQPGQGLRLTVELPT
ncbi:MAG: sensor histidine kinase [Caldilineaceae bacterium]